MPNIQFVLKGDKKLIRQLSKDYPERFRSIIVATLIEGTQEMATAARVLAPVKSGALRRSIGASVDVLRNQDNRIVAVVYAGGGGVAYASYQEYGTYDYAINPNSVKTMQVGLRAGFDIGKIFGKAFGNLTGKKGIQPVLYLTRGVIGTFPRMQKIFELKLKGLIAQINR